MNKEDYIEEFLNIEQFNFNNKTFRMYGNLHRNTIKKSNRLYNFKYENVWITYYKDLFYSKNNDKESILYELKMLINIIKTPKHTWKNYIINFIDNTIKKYIDFYSPYETDVDELKAEFSKIKRLDFGKIIKMYENYILNHDDDIINEKDDDFDYYNDNIFDIDMTTD